MLTSCNHIDVHTLQMYDHIRWRMHTLICNNIYPLRNAKEVEEISLKQKQKNWPELEESDDDKSVEATGVEDFVLGDAKSARDPRNRREEATERERLMEVNVVAVVDTTSVVYGSVWGLFLEDGKKSENYQGQAYVNRCRSKQTMRVHDRWFSHTRRDKETGVKVWNTHTHGDKYRGCHLWRYVAELHASTT